MIGNAAYSGATVTDNDDVVWRVDVLCTIDSSMREMMRCDRPCIIQDARAPYKIVAANGPWRNLCGFTGKEAIGATTKILQGARTDQDKARRFRESCQTTGAGRATMVNYKRSGVPFAHCIHAQRVGDFYVTRSAKVSDVAITRAVLRSLSPKQPVSPVLSIAIALLLTSAIIVFDGDDATTGALSALVVGTLLVSCNFASSTPLPEASSQSARWSECSATAEIVISALVLLPVSRMPSIADGIIPLIAASVAILLLVAQSAAVAALAIYPSRDPSSAAEQMPAQTPTTPLLPSVTLALLLCCAALLLDTTGGPLALVSLALVTSLGLNTARGSAARPASPLSARPTPGTSGAVETFIAGGLLLPMIAVLTATLGSTIPEAIDGFSGESTPDPISDRYLYGAPWLGN